MRDVGGGERKGGGGRGGAMAGGGRVDMPSVDNATLAITLPNSAGFHFRPFPSLPNRASPSSPLPPAPPGPRASLPRPPRLPPACHSPGSRALRIQLSARSASSDRSLSSRLALLRRPPHCNLSRQLISTPPSPGYTSPSVPPNHGPLLLRLRPARPLACPMAPPTWA